MDPNERSPAQSGDATPNDGEAQPSTGADAKSPEQHVPPQRPSTALKQTGRDFDQAGEPQSDGGHLHQEGSISSKVIRYVAGIIFASLIGFVAVDFAFNHGERIRYLFRGSEYRPQIKLSANGVGRPAAMFRRYRSHLENKGTSLDFRPPELEQMRICTPWEPTYPNVSEAFDAFMQQFSGCLVGGMQGSALVIAPVTDATSSRLSQAASGQFYCGCADEIIQKVEATAQ